MEIIEHRDCDPIIETKRLIMRPVAENDSEQIYAYRSDGETNKYQGWVPEKIEDVIDFVKIKVSDSINIIDTWFQWVIINKENNQIIGDVGVHFLEPENAQVEVGCTLKKESHRVGFATEALTEVIDYLFSKLNKHRIVTSIDPRNTRSILLVERIGFRKEAHFKESLFLNGKWVDDMVYALLKREWKSSMGHGRK